MRGPPSLRSRQYWQRLTEDEQEQRLQKIKERHQFKRKYPRLSRSQIISIIRSDRKNPQVYSRTCVICNSSRTTMDHRRNRVRLADRQAYSLYPVWYRSKLEPGSIFIRLTLIQ